MQTRKIAGALMIGALALTAPVFALPGQRVFHAVGADAHAGLQANASASGSGAHVNMTANVQAGAGEQHQFNGNASKAVKNMHENTREMQVMAKGFMAGLSMQNATEEMVRERLRMLEDHLEAKVEIENPGIKVALRKHRGLAVGLMVLENVSTDLPHGELVREKAHEIQQIMQNVSAVENRTEKVGFFRRILFGGDEEAGHELEIRSSEIESRIAKIRGALNSTEIPDSVREALMEKLNEMEQDRMRIEKEARAQKSHGLLGWLFRKK